MHVDDVLARSRAAEDHALAVVVDDDCADGVVRAAEVVVLEVHQTGVGVAEVGDVALRVLDVRVDVVVARGRPGDRDGVDAVRVDPRRSMLRVEDGELDEGEQQQNECRQEVDDEDLRDPAAHGSPLERVDEPVMLDGEDHTAQDSRDRRDQARS